MLHREVTGRLRLVITKEVREYMEELNKDLNKVLKVKEAMKAYGALTTLWYKPFISKEDILKEISWTTAEHNILELTGVISTYTYMCYKDKIEEIYDDIWNIPI